jgi:hypothetical protein
MCETMKKDGWKLEGLAFKDGHQRPFIENLAPWLTI